MFPILIFHLGHQRLGGDGLRILHRDISHNNVLLGKEGASEGDRGVLIDLDMAFRATDVEPYVRTNYNIVRFSCFPDDTFHFTDAYCRALDSSSLCQS
jgi:hypothetical protein